MTEPRSSRHPQDAPRLFAVPDRAEDTEPGTGVRLAKNGVPGTQVAVPDEGGVVEGRVVPRRAHVVDVRAAVDTVRVVATHDRTKAALRHLLYVTGGAVVLIRRLWDGRTTARYERMMRAAEATGDHASALEWEARVATFRRDRHSRRMDLFALPAKVVAALPKVALGVLALLATLGVLLAIAQKDIRQVAAPVLVIAHFVQLVVLVVSVTWGPLLLAVPWLVVLGLWSVGKKQATAPTWLATAADADLDVSIDETTIARALEALRIPQINAYLKQGLPLQYLTTARRDGRGTHAILRLPAGVTAERIGRRRADLATGLYRLAKEVWPTTGAEEGILDLWVADKGALAEGAGPYPLLTDGAVDVFKGVPFGRTLRGDPIVAPVMERNTITGGMPGQGKSSAARVIMAGAGLDPTAELRIWVPDTNFDFEAFRARCSRYVMGAENQHIEQILVDLRELHAEVQARGDLLVRYEEPAVTRELADKNIGMHPLFCLLEEAHIAITHKIHGEEISQLLVDIVRLGRKRGIHMIVSTQAPTKDSMPRDVTRNCSNGIAFAVGDHVANDALLGQGAYRGGHRATELIPGIDAGTAVVKGFSGQRSDMVQAYFLSVKRGNDQVTPIIERSLAEIARRGRGVPGRGVPGPAVEARDLLDDVNEVLGTERVRLADVPALLRELAPDWAAYRALSGTQLRDRLTEFGVRVTNTGNVPRIDPADVQRAVAERSTRDLDGG